MIICRSPLRISLGGGELIYLHILKKEGMVISAAINKYVYTTIIKPYKKGIYLKYSDQEKVKKLIKFVIQLLGKRLEIIKRYQNKLK